MLADVTEPVNVPPVFDAAAWVSPRKTNGDAEQRLENADHRRRAQSPMFPTPGSFESGRVHQTTRDQFWNSATTELDPDTHSGLRRADAHTRQ